VRPKRRGSFDDEEEEEEGEEEEEEKPFCSFDCGGCSSVLLKYGAGLVDDIAEELRTGRAGWCGLFTSVCHRRAASLLVR
jgi:hypothetical protein